MKLFIENGLEKTTFTDIGNECGIARTSVYEYFKTKDDILITYLEKSMDYNMNWIIHGEDVKSKLKYFIKTTEKELEKKYYLNIFLIQNVTVFNMKYKHVFDK